MQEIYQRGPITCSANSSLELQNYSGGIYEDKTGINTTNNTVPVVGWGVEGDIEYWKVQNSWDSYWGEEGYYRHVDETTTSPLISSYKDMHPDLFKTPVIGCVVFSVG